jgi:hypothetical protein
MKKTLTLFACLWAFIAVANAQNLESTLKHHVQVLSADNMRGRGIGSSQIQDAASYIKSQLKDAGLQVYDYPIKDSQLRTRTNENGDPIQSSGEVTDITYANFYTIISSPTATNEYTLLSTYYSGLGVDTIKGYEIIKSSADVGASNTALTIELAKYFASNKDKLNKNLVILFSEDNDMDTQNSFFAKNFSKGTIDMAFLVDGIGYLGTDPDEMQYYYTISDKIKDGSKILQPILLKDADFPTYASTLDDFSFPTISILSEENMGVYDDNADNLNYPMMAKLTTQLENVITTFSNTKIVIDTTTEKKSSYNDTFNAMLEKNTSYFGINLMIGNSFHYYTEGRMTGKTAMSYSAGLFYKWQVANSWALKLDANYERAFANRHDGWYKSNVLSVPLSIMWTTGYKGFEFFLGVGPYYDYTLSANLAGEDVSWDDFNRYEIGWQWNISIRIAHFTMGYYTKNGITNIMKDSYPIDGKIKDNNGYFYIGISF